jgi:hypothetical protein
VDDVIVEQIRATIFRNSGAGAIAAWYLRRFPLHMHDYGDVSNIQTVGLRIRTILNTQDYYYYCTLSHFYIYGAAIVFCSGIA